MKKKGYSLLMAIVSIGIIAILGAALVALARASYNNTLIENRRNALRIKAESGIEEQIYFIRNYILNNPDDVLLTKDSSLTLSAITQADDLNPTDGIRRDVELTDIRKIIGAGGAEVNTEYYTDPRTGREVKFLRITSKCEYVKKDASGNFVAYSSPVIVETYIDRTSIYNEYFERIFNKSSFTTAPKDISAPLNSRFVLNNRNLDTTGRMLLQGDVNFYPIVSTIVFGEGDVQVKSTDYTSFITSIDSSFSSFNSNPINFLKDVEGGTYDGIWRDKAVNYLPLCNIIYPSDNPNADEAQEIITGGSSAIDPTKLQMDPDPLDPVKVVTFKAKAATGVTINFQKLIDGEDELGDSSDSLYWQICERLKLEYGSTEYLKYYGSYHKILLFDGDLLIEDDPNRIFNNYIIYCTGTVTFAGKAQFYNSSVFAESIIINGDVKFNGVGTAVSKAKTIDGRQIDMFTSNKKDKINRYFINNLEGYGEYIRFHKLFWRQY